MVSSIDTAVGTERKVITELPGPKSRALHERRQAVVSAGLTQGFPIYIDRAEGAILVDVDGNQILDLGSGIAVTTIGHAVPELVDAVSAQVAAFTHTCFMVNPYESYVEVCEELATLTPGDFAKTTALFNSGAEAIENAVKIARLATGRQAIVVFDHAYHGRTNLTMALTAKNMPYKDRFGPFAPEVYRVPMSYPFRDGLSGAEAAALAIKTIETQVGAKNVAGLLIEPIQGEGGFVVPADGFLPALSEWTTANGVVFIADEIQSGFCRTGDWFAVNHEGVIPDIVATAKGLAGGMPLAGVTGRAELMNAVHEGGLGGTYGGNPVACAAALATIKTLRDRNLVARAREIGDILFANLRSLAKDVAIIGDVRGRGAMVAMEFIQPGTKEPNAAAVKAIVNYCNQHGVIAISCGTYGNVVRLLPPLVITDEQLADGLDVLGAAVRSAELVHAALRRLRTVLRRLRKVTLNGGGRDGVGRLALTQRLREHDARDLSVDEHRAAGVTGLDIGIDDEYGAHEGLLVVDIPRLRSDLTADDRRTDRSSPVQRESDDLGLRARGRHRRRELESPWDSSPREGPRGRSPDRRGRPGACTPLTVTLVAPATTCAFVTSTPGATKNPVP